MNVLNEIDFIPESGQQLKLHSKDKSDLSSISLDLIETILKKRVTIIFSQGPLNITPIVSCLYATLNDQNSPNNNIVIGLPKQIFQEKYKEYTTEYFSLLYRKTLNSSVTNPFFFYKDILWCKGKIDEENNELFDITIEKYPVHGSRTYRTAYENAVSDKLKSGHYNQNPKIVLIPIDHSIPSNITKINKINFKEKNYNIKNFNPKLIILESINERRFQFDHLKNLIEKTRHSKTKLVLHFSWPYLRGLENFLSNLDLNNNSDIEMFHFGKRFCLETKNKFQKPPNFAIPLSLEGKLWDTVYYPETTNEMNFSIFALTNPQDHQFISFESLISSYSSIDNRLQNIRDSVKFENIESNFIKNILIFPTVIDSFLAPSEIKVGSYIDRINAFRYITIQDFLKYKMDADSHSFRSFQSLCSDVESCKDISRELRGLRTHSALNKKTLLQIYFIEEIQKLGKKIFLLQNKESLNEEIRIIIPKLHPFFETRKNNFESLQYFLDSFTFLLNHIKFPKVIKRGDKIVINVGAQDLVIFSKGRFTVPSCEKIHKIIDKNKKFPLEILITKETDFLEISAVLKIRLPFFRIEEFNESHYKKEYCNGLEIYRLKITPEGQYLELFMSDFSNLSKSYSNSLNYLIKFITVTNRSSETHNIEINIDFMDHSMISRISQEKLTKCKLLLSGPLPFQTISSGESFISQDYNMLLLPFKEIIFFAYPGKNLQRIVKQLQLYKDIFSEEPTKISNIDLIYSIDHMKKSKRYEFPQINSIDNFDPQQIADGDTIFDAAVRTELLDESKASEDEKEEILTLKEIWTRIGKKRQPSPVENAKTSSLFTSDQRGQIVLKIKFNDDTEDTISFMSGTLIRKKNGEDFILTEVDDLSENDEILYIESANRESIDNFLLKDFVQETGISLEQIFEPFYCLKLFYKTLNSINYYYDYPANIMKKMYWLDDTQNIALFKMIQILLRDQNLEDLKKELLDNNNIYSGLILPEELASIFSNNRNQITYENLFKIAKIFGISLKQGTFRQYCTFALNDRQHYYFRDETDLLVLGRLIGHQRIIEDYQAINSQGREVGTILQIIGRSIARVTRGESDPFNEMDASIEGKIQRCKILSVTFPLENSN